MNNRNHPKRLLVLTPHFGASSKSDSVLGFLLPALQETGYEIHLITYTQTTIHYRWKGVYVYSADHSSIDVLKKSHLFSAGLYLNLDADCDESYHNQYSIAHWLSIDSSNFHPILEAIAKQDYPSISSTIQTILKSIEDQFTQLKNLDNDEIQNESNVEYNLIAPLYESSEEGELSRGIVQHGDLNQIHFNPVYLSSFLNVDINHSTNHQCSNAINLIIIPSYYSSSEISSVLKLYTKPDTQTYVIYPLLQHIHTLLENNVNIILSSNYLKQKVLKLCGKKYESNLLVLHKCIDVPAEQQVHQNNDSTRFITMINNNTEMHNVDYLCTSFIDLFKDTNQQELHICFLSNSMHSEFFHHYNNLFSSKPTLRCHQCDMVEVEELLQSSDCYISINTSGCFDVYTLKAAAYKIPVLTAHHEIPLEYFDQRDILTYEFETESVSFENNSVSSISHTLRKETITTELERFVQQKELIQTKMESVKRTMLSSHNLDAWILSFDFYLKNKDRI